MQVLTLDEISTVDNFGGGMTENQCIGAMGTAGALAGAVAGTVGSGGIFSYTGFGIGGFLGVASHVIIFPSGAGHCSTQGT
jgi:hypothetical protein